ncbi:MAG: glycosyltransferase [Lachnospiraceae bacterium]|nr:glycosyltransferase [Lachnospiraceae bacterium]
MKEKIILSIGLLVSNRRDTIKKCLDSLISIRKAIPSELIIIDTGCEKDVREILKKYADVLEKFTWCNDLAKARNETLKYAHGEWYLYLDDDEWFTDTKELINFFKSGEYKKYECASYIQRNYLDSNASQYTDSVVSRMIKLTSDTQFVSKIHEYLTPIYAKNKGLHAVVDHFGYVYETKEALWKHYERNKVLLEEMIKEEPNNLRWYVQLAQEHRTVQEWQKLYDLSENCLKRIKENYEVCSDIFLGVFYAGKIVAWKETWKHKEGLFACKEALKDNRNTQLFHAFAELYMAWFCYWLEKNEEAEQHIINYFKWEVFFKQNQPLLLLQRSAPFVADCFDIVMKKSVYSMLICIGLRRGDTSYLKKYFHKLEWRGHHLYVFEDIVPMLIQFINRTDIINQDNINCRGLINKAESKNERSDLSENEKILKEVLQIMFAHGPMWQYFCDEMIKAEQDGNNMHQAMEVIRKLLPEAIQSEEVEYDKNAHKTNCDTSSSVSKETEEMKALAEQIKSQIRLLIENGMHEEAKGIIAQLQKMLPEDEELKEMERKL